MAETPKFVSAEEKYLDQEGIDWQKMSEFNDDPETYTRSLIEDGFSISELIDDLKYCIFLLTSKNVAATNPVVQELLTTFTRSSKERMFPIFSFLKHLGVPKIALQKFLREQYKTDPADTDNGRKERMGEILHERLAMLDILYENAAD